MLACQEPQDSGNDLFTPKVNKHSKAYYMKNEAIIESPYLIVSSAKDNFHFVRQVFLEANIIDIDLLFYH